MAEWNLRSTRRGWDDWLGIWLGILIAIIGLVAFGGFARGRWY